jgi:SAM-dependent MidA family methyltransferase
VNAWTTWQAATERALYGREGDGGGFFVREAPDAHFRTSVNASPLFAAAVARLLMYVDEESGRPDELTMVDVGAGRGELLTGVLAALPAEITARLRPYAVERAPRPGGLDERIIWSNSLPASAGLVGLLFANEWLDNVPVDVVEVGPDGVPHTVLVRTVDGAEKLGEPLPDGPDADWLVRWWPLTADPGEHERHDQREQHQQPGQREQHQQHQQHPESGAHAEPGPRAELGLPRDEAWAAAVRALDRGLAVAVDYAHFREDRPPFGTLTGYLDGREVRPVPDGSRDLTAHVALDACAAAGAAVRVQADGGTAAAPVVTSQRTALHALGVDGTRPPLALASSDPAAYVRQLAAAAESAELTDAAGLGGFRWLVQPLGGVPAPFN